VSASESPGNSHGGDEPQLQFVLRIRLAIGQAFLVRLTTTICRAGGKNRGRSHTGDVSRDSSPGDLTGQRRLDTHANTIVE